MQGPLGYGCCFIPSIATLPRSASTQSPQTNLTNTFGERSWPPLNGLSFSLWVHVERWGLDDHPVRLLTVYSPAETEVELFAIDVRPGCGCCVFVSFFFTLYVTMLMLTLMLTSLQIHPTRFCIVVRTSEVVDFPEAQLNTGHWHHVAVVMRGKPKMKQCPVQLFVDGKVML